VTAGKWRARKNSTAPLRVVGRSRLGGLDLLVNNAGIGGPAPAELPPGAEVRRQLDVNLLGAWRVGAACVDALLKITGNENLLDDSPVLQRSIRLRNPNVDPLSYVQVALLRRLRALPESSQEREGVLNTLLLSISGVSSGMLNTG
jgi:NAD(P)-dependent dehydrogenase (short-subunit alcohol dehydrogenase family)